MTCCGTAVHAGRSCSLVRLMRCDLQVGQDGKGYEIEDLLVKVEKQRTWMCLRLLLIGSQPCFGRSVTSNSRCLLGHYSASSRTLETGHIEVLRAYTIYSISHIVSINYNQRLIIPNLSITFPFPHSLFPPLPKHPFLISQLA